MIKRAVVGLSGGVDSAVAAALLKRSGYDVVGVLLEIPNARSPVDDAAAIAESLGIELAVVDVGREFQSKVIDYFLEEYAGGYTPNPCVICNPEIKFKALMEYAEKCGADWVASGHYAGTEFRDGRHLLLRDMSTKKDQSYMLHRLTQEILAKVRFPLFGLDKGHVREIASSLKLPVSQKKDSQELCFVPDNDHISFMRSCGAKMTKGEFVDTSGRCIGSHGGVQCYTVGQRKGLGISLPSPMYVLDIDCRKNTVTLGDEKELYKRELTCDSVKFIPFEKLEDEQKFTAKIRYAAKEVAAKLTPLDGDLVKVEFEEPQRAPSTGQYCVFYQDEVVVGGGRIT